MPNIFFVCLTDSRNNVEFGGTRSVFNFFCTELVSFAFGKWKNYVSKSKYITCLFIVLSYWSCNNWKFLRLIWEIILFFAKHSDESNVSQNVCYLTLNFFVCKLIILIHHYFSPYMVKYANLLSDLGIAQILLQHNLFSQGAGCLLAWMRIQRTVCWSADAIIFLAMKNPRI